VIKEVTITRDDYYTYCKFALAGRSRPNEKESKKWFKSSVINFGVWCIVGIVFFSIFQSKGFSLSKFHWPTALVILAPFLLFFIVFVVMYKDIQKKSSPKENGPILGKRIVEIDDAGIKDTSAFCTSIYNWKAFEDVVIHEGNVYLILDTMMAQIIPSSAFESQAEAEQFAKDIEELHDNLLQSTASASV